MCRWVVSSCITCHFVSSSTSRKVKRTFYLTFHQTMLFSSRDTFPKWFLKLNILDSFEIWNRGSQIVICALVTPRGAQGNPPSWRLCTPLAPSQAEEKLAKICHFWQIFQILLPQKHILSPWCPPHTHKKKERNILRTFSLKWAEKIPLFPLFMLEIFVCTMTSSPCLREHHYTHTHWCAHKLSKDATRRSISDPIFLA